MNPYDRFQALSARLNQAVLGQPDLIERLLIALLADGHVLLEGPPGLAKTRAVRSLADAVEADFHRIQFTPDLLPADITGTEVFHPGEGRFHFERGPLFHDLVLADEINRAPAKVQSALLEAMGERQISVGQATYALPALFMVVATQNPIEHEGTYPLPEAQLDRFLMHVRVDYPDATAERAILALARAEARTAVEVMGNKVLENEVAVATGHGAGSSVARLAQSEVFAARRAVLDLHLAPALEGYIVDLVAATRRPETADAGLAGAVRFGASPRAAIALERCARARAWLAGRDYVSPGDIQALAADVMRHRILLSYEAEAGGMTPDRLVERLLGLIPVP